jgi:hypothetical protein
MGRGTDRLRRTAAAFALAGLLGLPAGCGASGDTSTGGAPAAAGTKAPQKAEAGVSEAGMTDGCDAVHKLLAALDAGDKTTAESLKVKGKAKFDDVIKAAAKKDEQLASNASAMSQMLGFDLPEKPIYKSQLAEIYTVDCVAQYDAAALPS